MNRTIANCAFISATAVWLALSFCAPWVLSDKNSFLKGFVTHELLGFLGVIVTITLASTANLHLELNKLEEQIKKRVFNKTRCAIRRSAYWLIGMILIAIVIAVSKPLVVSNDEQMIAASLFNGAALLIVLFNILVLIDLVQIAFKLEPKLDD